MICACLIASGIFTTAEDSLFYFGERRTDKSSSTKFQGVETPSQSRYVGYFADVKNIYNMTLPPRKTLKIEKIVIHSIHVCSLYLQVWFYFLFVHFFPCDHSQILLDAETNSVTIHLSNCPPLYDDIKVQFFSSSVRTKTNPGWPSVLETCFFFPRLYLPRNEIDNPHKKKTWKIYREEFAVELYFEEVRY
uniref:C2 tensin-type domain-containing protein n=1 Tax=Neovison vison TaxID=452646 RepID=A0A8C7ERD9_NEOVI